MSITIPNSLTASGAGTFTNVIGGSSINTCGSQVAYISPINNIVITGDCVVEGKIVFKDEAIFEKNVIFEKGISFKDHCTTEQLLDKLIKTYIENGKKIELMEKFCKILKG